MASTHDLPLESGICLALIRHGDDHGYTIARRFEPGQPIGDVYSLSRPAVYRCLASLEQERLVASTPDKGNRGQSKKRLRLTPHGMETVREWLGTPVLHLRDMRLDFLAKMTLREMLGLKLGPLIRAQRAEFGPVLAGLAVDTPPTFTALWRREQALAVARFLDECEGRERPARVAAIDDTEPTGAASGSMVVSARNQLNGTVVSVRHGSILSSVKIAVDEGQLLTSTITREASDHLRLAPGSTATALFKATDVMIAVPPIGHSRRSVR